LDLSANRERDEIGLGEELKDIDEKPNRPRKKEHLKKKKITRLREGETEEAKFPEKVERSSFNKPDKQSEVQRSKQDSFCVEGGAWDLL